MTDDLKETIKNLIEEYSKKPMNEGLWRLEAFSKTFGLLQKALKHMQINDYMDRTYGSRKRITDNLSEACITIGNLRVESKHLQNRIDALERQLSEQPSTNVWNDWNKDHEPVIGNWIEWSNDWNDGQLTKAKRINNIFYALWYPLSHELGAGCWKWQYFKKWGQWRYCERPE